MSDYMFMLDNHLSSEQSRMVAKVQAAAASANINVFLTGGALRDMLGGFPLREIDFTVEGNPLKLAKTLETTSGAKILATDEHRKLAWLEFPGEVLTTIGMARHERPTKAGGKPQVHAATIHEDLRGRDFTVNAIALSLSRGSRGLLIDPTNGAGDLERKELRATGNYTLYDDPSRILRLLRLRVRLGFSIEERTKQQYDNAREANIESRISPDQLYDELKQISEEPDPGEVLRVFQEEKLLGLFSEALAAGQLNLQLFEKLHKARQLVPFGVHFPLEMFGLFLYLLTEKLPAKERAALIKHLSLKKQDVTAWNTLEARSKKLERDLKSPKLNKPSKVYLVASQAPGDQVIFLLLKSVQRLVQDRLKHYLQKYLPMALEITDREVLAAGAEPGTPKGDKLRQKLIVAHLDARPKKVEPEVVPEVQMAAAGGPGARRIG
jgi:tRNA nucleotidyltransferase/poly(A) polymerase